MDYGHSQYIKSAIRRNVYDFYVQHPDLDRKSWNVVAPVIEKVLDDTLREITTVQTSYVTIPDSLIDAAGLFTLQGRHEKRKFAAFTIVRNEPFFLEVWCRYYGQAFGFENLYVLDNDTDDGSIEHVKQIWPVINVFRVSSESACDWAWCTHIVKTFQRMCLRGYEVVLFSDADEFLIPENQSLVDYCEHFRSSSRQYARAQGWGVVQNVDSEPTLPDNSQGFLHQRSEIWRMPGYDKTLLSKIPLEWSKGSHHIYVDGKKLYDDPVDQTLSLVHLRDVDVHVFVNQAKRRHELNPNSVNIHGSTDVEQVKTFFRRKKPPWNSGAHEYAPESKKLPNHWKISL